MKKNIMSFSLVLLLVGIFTISIDSEAAALTRTYSGSFSNAWAKSASSGYAKLEYGFNTAYINEDVAYAYNSNAVHYAKIVNGSGSHAASSKNAGVWSNLEVQHSGSSITYSCVW